MLGKTIRFFCCVAVVLSAAVCFAQGDSSANLHRDSLAIIGGVEVLQDGVIQTVSKEKSGAVARWLQSVMMPIHQDLLAPSSLRKVSLKKINAAIQRIVDRNAEFTDDVRYLGGLTSIQYIVALPQENDILLVGKGEGWTVDGEGNVVGAASGSPLLTLEDLLTVFRAFQTTQNQSQHPNSIRCSFDYSPELRSKAAKLETEFTGLDKTTAPRYAAELENAYGTMSINIDGVSATSRLAKILVAADYKLKRYALGLEQLPLPTTPSYASLIDGAAPKTPTQFILAADYSAVEHDSQKLIWKLGAANVKVTSRAGNDRAAENWSAKMSKQYDSLAAKVPVFAELQREMALVLAVALIQQQNLLQKADCKLPLFFDEKKLRSLTYPKPLSVPCKSAITKNGTSVVVVCGGVEINPVPALQQVRLNPQIDKERESLTRQSSETWWTK